MSPTEKGLVFTEELAKRLRLDLEAAEQQARLVSALLKQTNEPPDAPGMAFISVAIDRAYTALEAAFARIAREDVLARGHVAARPVDGSSSPDELRSEIRYGG